MGRTELRAGRGRRPAEDVRRAALAAAADILFSDGATAVTHERVAGAAGVSKTTLYKWWPSAGALAVDAYFERSAPALEFPDSGDIVRDLTQELRAFIRFMTGTGAGAAMRGLVAVAQSDERSRAELLDRYMTLRREIGAGVVRRAQERGQIRPDVDPDVVVDQLWGACYFRLLIPNRPLRPELADELVRNAMYGAAARGPTPTG
jgi:AcrR family transcriptional regulator